MSKNEFKKCTLKECRCGKTFSKLSGNLETGLCDVCIDKGRKDDAKRKVLNRNENNTPSVNLEKLSYLDE